MKVPLTVGSWVNDARSLPLEELRVLIVNVADVPTDARAPHPDESGARGLDLPRSTATRAA